jgi:precorrin-6B C5,15-methyltransferase / cobalt-precorrin-6B C5,C15-methyltransferase
VTVIGLGLGEVRLDARAREALSRAGLLVGGTRQLAAFPDHPARRLPITGPLSRLLDAVAEAANSGTPVAVLADGDPLYFGIGRTLLERFGPEGLTFFPNVTAVGTACARLGRPWHELPVVSLHGRSDVTPLFAALASRGQAVVYTDAVNTPGALAALVRARAGDRFVVTVLEDLGLPAERIRQLGLEEAAGLTCSSLNLALFEATRPPEVALGLGLPDAALARRDGVFTKFAVRALVLAALDARPGDVLYDIGAGVGTVALPASLTNPGGPVFAVERDPDRHRLLADNIRRTGALTVAPVAGQAPAVLADLPDPDRVFVGGGLSGGAGLLDTLANRLRPGGRIVVAAVLLGSIDRARASLTRPDFTLSLTQLQASQAVPLADDLRFRADNPVCILTAVKEARP